MASAAKLPRSELEKNQVLGLLHLQSTPRKAEVVTWGYDLGTWSGRRDNCATILLSLLLLATAITVKRVEDVVFVVVSVYCSPSFSVLALRLPFTVLLLLLLVGVVLVVMMMMVVTATTNRKASSFRKHV